MQALLRKGSAGHASLALLGAVLLLYLIIPLVYFLFTLPWSYVPGQLSDPQALAALITSLLSASLAIAITTLFGIPLAYILARRSFPGRALLTMLVYLPLVFPPVVSGIMLLLLYGPYGPIGGPFANAGLELDTSFAGIVLAQVFVASPFVIIAARSAFEAVDPALEQVAATLGKGAWEVFWRVNLPVARAGIIAGLLLGWLRALGEFGATVVLAYHPYTLPVYLYVQLSGTGVDAALPLALLSLAVSVLGVGLVFWIQSMSRRKRA
ncbi:MAG TPA: ABC transporter permease [Ktedonobacteraceae bacterium]|jgi:molybdate/tungstate transport system permease protein|nr:ABC transporter permease [Ktedonobacteraceae bacterium]